MSQKLKTIIIIILVIITPSFFGGLLKLMKQNKIAANPSPSPSPIRYLGWPEYLNETYRYKLKYPYDWTILQSESNFPDSVAFINIKLTEYPQKPHLTLNLKTEPFSGQNLTNYPEIQELIAIGHAPRQLTISKSPAVFIDNLGKTGEVANTYILHKEHVFRFSWEETEIGLIRPHEDTLLQIIASFEFL